MLEKTLETLWDSKEIKPVNPKGNQPWIFIGRTDAEAEASIFWPPDAKSRFTGKTLKLGKIEGKRRKGLQRMRRLDGIINSMDMSLRKFQELVKNKEAWHGRFHGVTKSWTQLTNWTSPDGQHWNQTDYILCSQKWRSSIQSAKTRQGADCDSDHELLIAKFNLNWRKWGKPLDHSGMT